MHRHCLCRIEMPLMLCGAVAAAFCYSTSMLPITIRHSRAHVARLEFQRQSLNLLPHVYCYFCCRILKAYTTQNIESE